MGDAAELILEGIVCEQCGDLFDDDEPPGHPRSCEYCLKQDTYVCECGKPFNSLKALKRHEHDCTRVSRTRRF